MSTARAHIARQITPGDLPAVVRVHLLAFPNSALTSLGAEAVRRYYHWQLTGPHDLIVALCIAEGDELTAFCFGGSFRGALEGFLRTNRRYLTWRVATRPWIWTNEIVRKRVSDALRSLGGRRSGRAANAQSITPVRRKLMFGVLSIAVHPNKAGTGQGHHLMCCLEQAAQERQFSEMYLTVSPTNRHAVSFYERLGWKRDPGQNGVWTGGMRKDLSS
jgi:GNAT superfamily N-acetyltransferase